MKRIKAACICQTLHFQCKENTDQTYAGKVVREEVEHYKHQLDRSCTKYRILSEVEQSDAPSC